MEDLFTQEVKEEYPLALRMTPLSFDEFVGQEHIIGKEKLLKRLIETDRVGSLIFYGPPGTGKSALARIIARKTQSYFKHYNASFLSVNQIKNEIEYAYHRKKFENKKTIIFLDEIHHFNKTQQDVLLPDIEKGVITLIATTTENPFYYINKALLSRSSVFEFKPLNENDLYVILKRAISDKKRGLGDYNINVSDDVLKHLIKLSEGDARKALNGLEVSVLSTTLSSKGKVDLTLEIIEESIQKKVIIYDKKGDSHYNTISAFIKSMRGSDPDASLYWLAKMLYTGEDPRFIARRIVICASEDVGNADPMALVIANACFQAVEFIGMPEARIPLAQATIYVATAPKSNACYTGIENALADIEKSSVQEVPEHLTKKGKKKYNYPHNYKNGFVKQEYLSTLKRYYHPTLRGYEKKIDEYLKKIKTQELKNKE